MSKRGIRQRLTLLFFIINEIRFSKKENPMSKYFTDSERLNFVKDFKKSNLTLSKYAKEKHIARTTLRDWINAYNNIGGSFIRINNFLEAENTIEDNPEKDVRVNVLTENEIYKKSRHFSRFDHSIVVIEFKSLKITTSLEQANVILEKIYAQF